MTNQEKALKQVKRMWGNTAFTEHHVHYFRVGCRMAGKVITAMGDSWEEAIAALDNKRGTVLSSLVR